MTLKRRFLRFWEPLNCVLHVSLNLICFALCVMPSNLAMDHQEVNEQLLLDAIVGVAVFDLSGLPKTYLTARDDLDSQWIQTVFQAFGLRTLFMDSLQLQDFQHAVVHGEVYSAVLMAQPLQYAAALIRRDDFEQLSEVLIEWMKTFELGMLASDTRFCER